MWTLSRGWALMSWIDPDLTTVSRRWVWPAGPVIVATGAGAVAVATAPAAAGATALPSACPSASRWRADFDRWSRCSGIFEAAPEPPEAAAASSPGVSHRWTSPEEPSAFLPGLGCSLAEMLWNLGHLVSSFCSRPF